MEKIKYITNKELLSEIHKSKKSYCSYEREEYSNYNIIVAKLEDITPELKEAALNKYNNKAEVKITEADLVYRVMTDKHVPLDPNGKFRKSSYYEAGITPSQRTVFPPFKHYIFENGEYREVGRSHWIGGVSNGEFRNDHGMINNRLATMIMMLVDRYSKRGNFRGYSYRDEMCGCALTQMSQIALQFDEYKSENPFAFYTQVIKNSFRRILNIEKRNQEIRDDLLMAHGTAPSFTRQVENEMEYQQQAAAPEDTKKKRGRKPKSATT